MSRSALSCQHLEVLNNSAVISQAETAWMTTNKARRRFELSVLHECEFDVEHKRTQLNADTFNDTKMV